MSQISVAPATMLVSRGRVPSTATDSATFAHPPLDNSLTLPQIYEWHGVHSPKHPLFMYEESTGTIKSILWKQAAQAVVCASDFIRSRVESRAASESVKVPVVGLLASGRVCRILGGSIVGGVRTSTRPEQSTPSQFAGYI